MPKVYHKESTNYILKLKGHKLYVRSYGTYTEKISDAMHFDSEKPAQEKLWADMYDTNIHTVIKHTERISNTYEEVVFNE